MNLTYLDSNSWLIEIGGKRILLDPWLVGDLIFGNLPWFFRGTKAARPIPDNVDLILLSQGLEDHAHPPTLKQLDRTIPVVGSPSAAKVAQELGYVQVVTLNHGETFTQEGLEIRAVPGSPIGPQLVENGYLIQAIDTGQKLYYEPHGYHSTTLKEAAPVDVVITPIVNLKLPLLGSLIKGQQEALALCRWLQPQVILPTAAGGDVVFEGVLNALLKAEGTADELQALLTQNDLSTQVIEPKPGEMFSLELKLNNR